MTEPIVVRLFSDYCGDLVIWAPGPTEYDDLDLDPSLVADLRAWDAAYYGGLENYEWRDEQARLAHAATADALARRLARELGDDFVVEVDGGQLFRSPHAAPSPTSAAVLGDRARAKRAESEEIE